MPRSVARASLLGLVRAYRAVPRLRPPACRYVPSCSAYAEEALLVHGAGRGSVLALRRLLRCHPWGGSGWDPVPEPCCSPSVVGAAHPLIDGPAEV